MVTGTPSAAIIRLCHTPCPPGCRCSSVASPCCSIVTVNSGAGANTITFWSIRQCCPLTGPGNPPGQRGRAAARRRRRYGSANR